MSWVDVARSAAAFSDGLLAIYALLRGLQSAGSARYMRFALAGLAVAYTYAQLSSASDQVPVSSRTWVGWLASLEALACFVLAVCWDLQNSSPSRT